jgi:hypothetical protein
MTGQRAIIFTVLCMMGVGFLFSACPSFEQRQATYHLVCTRESQALLMVHGQVYSDETVKAEIDKRYAACMKYYAAH